MTPQFIMRCAVNGGLKEHFQPVGYERGKWDTPEGFRSTAETEIECMNWSDGYSEPGYTDPAKGVLFANWNHFDRRVTDILERYGFACEWSDEWTTCEHCQKAVRTSPDSYGYQPSYVCMNECEIVCLNCLQENDDWMLEHLRTLENRSRSALNLSDVDPTKYGYRQIEDGFESGWHPGQNDDPKKITTDLRAQGVKTPLLFKVDGVGQFDIGFSVWTRDEETEENS